jgi:hypothetical protein
MIPITHAIACNEIKNMAMGDFSYYILSSGSRFKPDGSRIFCTYVREYQTWLGASQYFFFTYETEYRDYKY